MEAPFLNMKEENLDLEELEEDKRDLISLQTMEENILTGEEIDDDDTSMGGEVFETVNERTEDFAEMSNSSNSSYEDPFRSNSSETNLIRKKRKPSSIELVFAKLNHPWVMVLMLPVLIGVCAITITLTYMMADEPTSKITVLNGVVSSDNEICSSIARDVLRKGGSAVDAAIAGTFCLGVVRPFASGLGGGGYMLIYNNQNETSDVIDFREIAPKASSQDMFLQNLPPSISSTRTADAKYIAVPGELQGLQLAYSKYGVLPWVQLVLPAENLARNGFFVDAQLAKRIQDNLYLILTAQNFNLSLVFAPSGSPLVQGQLFMQPTLADTLLEIAYNGGDSFYQGDLAQKLVNDIQLAGGIITLDDMKMYKAQSRVPQKGFYHGLGILSVPPSSAGGVAVSEILNILERYNLPLEGTTVRSLQWIIESFKHAFSDLSVLGDPDFINVTGFVSTLSEKEYSSKIRRRILEDQTFDPSYYGILGSPLVDMGSSSMVVVDANRNAVSFTSSINFPFGSGIYSPSTGIMLNNQMASFTISTDNLDNTTEPILPWGLLSKGNKIEPYKRPLSSLTPTILLRDDDVYLVVASSAGTETGQAIITSVVQTILDIAGFRLEPLMAVSRSRCHHQLIPNKVYCEYDYPPPLISGLQAIGHQVVLLADASHSLGSVQVIVRGGDGLLYAASDPRTNGKPAGY